MPAAPSNSSLVLTFRGTGLWHLMQHTTAVCALCQHRRYRPLCHFTKLMPDGAKINYKAYFLEEFSTGANPACNTWSCNLCPFCLNLYFYHHIRALCKAAISQTLQTLKQCSQYEITLPTSSLSRPTCHLEPVKFRRCRPSRRVSFSGSQC